VNTESKVDDRSPAHRWTVMVLGIVILAFSLLGFGDKFVQFVQVARGEPDGVFALTPIINYLLASFGFLCLIGWAATNGMFHDIERPKLTMLENEQQLDGPLPLYNAITRKKGTQ